MDIVGVIAVSIVVVVVNHSGIAVIAEGKPTVMKRCMAPVHPTRAPSHLWDPVPAEAETPLPAAVVGYAPPPGIKGNPGISPTGIPHPTAVIIGPPGAVIDMRHPNISIGAFIHPVAVFSQFRLIGGQFRGEVTIGDRSGQEEVTAAVPIGKGILVSGGEAGRAEAERALGGHQPLQGSHLFRGGFSGRFHGTLDHPQFGLLIAHDPEPV